MIDHTGGSRRCEAVADPWWAAGSLSSVSGELNGGPDGGQHRAVIELSMDAPAALADHGFARPGLNVRTAIHGHVDEQNHDRQDMDAGVAKRAGK